MLNILLIWLAFFVNSPDQLNCRQYRLDISEAGFFERDTSCYVSTFEKKMTRDRLIVTTDSISVKFAVMRYYTIRDGFQAFAIIVGQPDQLYVIREMTRENGAYYFSALPIRMSNRIERPINAIAIEVSNQKICN
jgi:hypothetical protein